MKLELCYQFHSITMVDGGWKNCIYHWLTLTRARQKIFSHSPWMQSRELTFQFHSKVPVLFQELIFSQGYWNCSSCSFREWNYFFSSVQKMACTVELFVPELELFLPPSMTPWKFEPNWSIPLPSDQSLHRSLPLYQGLTSFAFDNVLLEVTKISMT